MVNRSKSNCPRIQRIRWINSGRRCRCGRIPEKNKEKGFYFAFSLSCKCGGDEINFVVRTYTKQVALDNWESLIRRTPYKHRVAIMKTPDMPVPRSFFFAEDDPYNDHYVDPLVRYTRNHGGHCAGIRGGCS